MLSGMPASCTPPPATVGRPAARAFESAGYRTITDLEGASERELLALHGVGPRAIEILRRERGQTRALTAALVAAERHASSGVRPARRRPGPGGRQPRPRAGGPGPRQLLPGLLHARQIQPRPDVTKGPSPASQQVTGPHQRGGWGIRTPEGFHPTCFPNAPTRARAQPVRGVLAGQRAGRMVRDASGRP